jgi:hypothetical protein
MDADIEETAHDAAENEKDRRPEMVRHGEPVVRIKNGVNHGRRVPKFEGAGTGRTPTLDRGLGAWDTFQP